MKEISTRLFTKKDKTSLQEVSAEGLTNVLKKAIAIDYFSSLQSVVHASEMDKEQFLLLPKSTVYHIARIAHEHNKPEALEWCIEVLASLSPAEFNALSLHPMTFNEIALAALAGHPKAFNALTHVLDVLPLEELHSMTLLNIVRACIASSPGALSLLAENVNSLNAEQLVLMHSTTVYHLADAACQGYPEVLCSMRNAIAQLTPKQKVLLGTDTLQKLKEASVQQPSVLEVYQLFSKGLEDTEDDNFLQRYDQAIDDADNNNFDAINALVPELENISLLELRTRKNIFIKLTKYAHCSLQYKPFDALANVCNKIGIDAFLDLDDGTLLNILAIAHRGHDKVYFSIHRLIKHIPVHFYTHLDSGTFVNMTRLQEQYLTQRVGPKTTGHAPLDACFDEWRLMNRKQFCRMGPEMLGCVISLASRSEVNVLRQLSKHVFSSLYLNDILYTSPDVLVGILRLVKKYPSCSLVLDVMHAKFSHITKSQFCSLDKKTLMLVVQSRDVYPKLFTILKPMIKTLSMDDINRMAPGTVEVLQSPSLGLVDYIVGLKLSQPKPVIKAPPMKQLDCQSRLDNASLDVRPVKQLNNPSWCKPGASPKPRFHWGEPVSPKNSHTVFSAERSRLNNSTGELSLFGRQNSTVSTPSDKTLTPSVKMKGPSLSLRR